MHAASQRRCGGSPASHAAKSSCTTPTHAAKSSCATPTHAAKSKPAERLGVEWRGRGAALAKGAAVGCAQAWSPATEQWSSEASTLYESLNRSPRDGRDGVNRRRAEPECDDGDDTGRDDRGTHPPHAAGVQAPAAALAAGGAAATTAAAEGAAAAAAAEAAPPPGEWRCKATVYASGAELEAKVLTDGVAASVQLACGHEAHLRRAPGQTRSHLSVRALDESALERALLALVCAMRQRAEALDIEIRWALRQPQSTAEELLERWQRAVDACQTRYPLRQLRVTLHPDGSSISLRLCADGWEEWHAADEVLALQGPLGGPASSAGARCGDSARVRQLAARVAAPFVLSWLLSHVRYGHAASALLALSAQQEATLLAHPQTLRELGTQSGALPIVVVASEPSALVVCGPRPCLRKARELFRAWEEHCIRAELRRSAAPAVEDRSHRKQSMPVWR